VFQNSPDYGRVIDEADHPETALTMGADQGIDLKDLLDQACPIFSELLGGNFRLQHGGIDFGKASGLVHEILHSRGDPNDAFRMKPLAQLLPEPEILLPQDSIPQSLLDRHEQGVTVQGRAS
jgi:hypothetical protein